MRIGVYTICLNEEKFAARWANTVAEADCAFVADTGSTDDTIAILHEHRIPVERITVKPWRFDDARNAALALLPDNLDVVISLDMDETLAPDWRANLEAHWHGTRMRYGYVWSWTPSGQPEMRFLSDKIAGRFTHRWKHPVHEILTPTVPEVMCVCEQVIIEHRADTTKSRGQYLDLLQLAVAEDPHDDRSAHYMGREYYFHQRYAEAITELTRHLTLPRATWATERASSMRYIAKCHQALGDRKAAYQWFLRATLEDDSSRDPLIDAARFCLACDAFYATIDFCDRAVALPLTTSYMSERYANYEGPFDLAAVAYFHIGDRQKAIELAAEAVRLNPDDQRLRNNLSMMGT